MSQIAKLAGVSRCTVSRVLDGTWQARRISAETATRVQKIATDNYYRPNLLVKGFQVGRTQTLALILPNIRSDYFSHIAAGVEAEAQKHGYHLLIMHVADSGREPAEIEVLLQRRVDGFILHPRNLPENMDQYRRLVKQGVPLVFVDSYYPEIPCPAVVGEDEKGASLAAVHLLKLGHKRIAYFATPFPESTHLNDRRRGFKKTLAAHDVHLPEAFYINDLNDFDSLVRAPRPPTAIVCETDYNAIDIINKAPSLGVRIPEDLAVIGFSDCMANVELFRVPLTSVRMDLDEMGRLAMLRFLDEVNKPKGKFEVTRVPAQLIVRASCGSRQSSSTPSN